MILVSAFSQLKVGLKYLMLLGDVIDWLTQLVYILKEEIISGNYLLGRAS